MKRRPLVLAALVLGGLSSSARAQSSAPASPPPSPPPSSDARAEAADRFDRGIALFKQGDAAGALAEFRRVYQISPNVLVLYNIGLVDAQLGRSVDATDALSEVLAHPGTLSAARLELAKKTRDQEAARIAEVTVAVAVAGASIEIDGVEAARAPLDHPLRVAGGTHVVGAVAPGFAPLRKEITIASAEKQTLSLDLVPMQGRMAHVAVKTHLPGADLFVDSERVGTTPLPASVSIAPGSHRIEMRRAAYVTAHADVTLGDGAVGEVALEPAEDRTAVAAGGSKLALGDDTKDVVVTIDGHASGLYAAPIAVAPGPHELLVERGGFDPLLREVRVDLGRTTTVHVALEPTAEHRAEYVARARSRRTWGLVTTIGGAVIGGAGAVILAYDAHQRSSAQNELTFLGTQTGHGQACQPGELGNIFTADCFNPKQAANKQITNASTGDIFGWSGVGVGAAAVVLGVTLYLMADDPHAYDRPPASDSLGLAMHPTFWPSVRGGGFGVEGMF